MRSIRCGRNTSDEEKERPELGILSIMIAIIAGVLISAALLLVLLWAFLATYWGYKLLFNPNLTDLIIFLILTVGIPLFCYIFFYKIPKKIYRFLKGRLVKSWSMS